jgi:hypothetical protein
MCAARRGLNPQGGRALEPLNSQNLFSWVTAAAADQHAGVGRHSPWQRPTRHQPRPDFARYPISTCQQAVQQGDCWVPRRDGSTAGGYTSSSGHLTGVPDACRRRLLSATACQSGPRRIHSPAKPSRSQP